MDLKVGDAVEVTQKDLKHECVYKGQRGRVVELFAKEATIHLKCGHLWNIALSALKPLGAIDEAPVVETPEEDDDWRYDVSDDA